MYVVLGIHAYGADSRKPSITGLTVVPPVWWPTHPGSVSVGNAKQFRAPFIEAALRFVHMFFHVRTYLAPTNCEVKAHLESDIFSV